MTLLELFKLLRKHLALVIVLPIVLAVATAGVSWGLLDNQYTAKVSVYVLNSKEKEGTANTTAYNDLTASQLMANDIATLAKSDTVQEKTAQSLGMESLKGYKISVESSTTTRVIDISVTAEKAEAASIVANEIAKVLSTVAQQVMGVESVNVVDQAKVPVEPSGPSRAMYTAVAFLAGIFLAVAIVVVLDMVNTRVRNPEEAEELLGLPVIGRIPTIKN
ncbi:lipopolysaccharide biosynthesis protein [Paraeggerthella hongkongensis]|uniref:YveK family protein n=1 Tax=Paraeggerthella TaxID=651554 RepID=UPI001C0F9A3F|nr:MULTISPECIES: Wzz/FepE/Etk N-terminal domain-containing protein [Paraeggerthella]MBU5405320.1 lipopolysaccharide biosynthesis protein [Paraeggerthella hongkongensis]MCD2433310.1 Wzz/FepE/Etk N-terminal domain-containing protein [Paraeggerthella hominis]MDY3982051.1 Wzz/FepE/Etk N-terminal domain-containing protein [Paraeggerthella sp.]